MGRDTGGDDVQFNPNSLNAQLAALLKQFELSEKNREALCRQHAGTLQQIQEMHEESDKRMTALEQSIERLAELQERTTHEISALSLNVLNGREEDVAKWKAQRASDLKKISIAWATLLVACGICWELWGTELKTSIFLTAPTVEKMITQTVETHSSIYHRNPPTKRNTP